MYNKIMTIDYQIRDKKLQYNINREAAEISALSSGKIDTYEYLTGEEIVLSNQKQKIEQAKFTYTPIGKIFKKQTKTIEGQGKQQVDALNTLKPIKDNRSEDILKCKEIFEKLSNKRMSEIQDIAKQIDFNNLTYYLKSPNLASINFIGFRGPMYVYNEIKNGNMSMENIEQDQKQFKSDLNFKKSGNTKKKSADQIKTIENIKNLYNSRQKVIGLFNDYAKVRSEAIYKTKQGTGLKILTSKQML